ncbi:MAG: peptidoglycan recognition family protein, partial [Candidatus Riflebacteria bacterium]
SYHMNERKWGDIAYHLLIAPSGKVYEGRDPRFAGDSGTKYDTEGLLMICFLGTYEKQLPAPEARYAMKKLVKSKMNKYHVGSEKIWCHRDLAQTDCPGTALYKWVKMQKWD